MRNSLFALALASVLGGTGLASASPRSDGFHLEVFGKTWCSGNVPAEVSCDHRIGRTETRSQAAMPSSSAGLGRQDEPGGSFFQRVLKNLKTAAASATSERGSTVR